MGGTICKRWMDPGRGVPLSGIWNNPRTFGLSDVGEIQADRDERTLVFTVWKDEQGIYYWLPLIELYQGSAEDAREGLRLWATKWREKGFEIRASDFEKLDRRLSAQNLVLSWGWVM